MLPWGLHALMHRCGYLHFLQAQLLLPIVPSPPLSPNTPVRMTSPVMSSWTPQGEAAPATAPRKRPRRGRREPFPPPHVGECPEGGGGQGMGRAA